MEQEKIDPKKTEFITRNMFWLASALLAVFFIYVFCITFMEIPDKNSKYVDIILGFLSGTIVSTVTGYYFGTSNSNRQKDKSLDDMLEIHRGVIQGSPAEVVKEIKNAAVEIKDDIVRKDFKELKKDVMDNVEKAKDLFDPKDIPGPLDPDAQ